MPRQPRHSEIADRIDAARELLCNKKFCKGNWGLTINGIGDKVVEDQGTLGNRKMGAYCAEGAINAVCSSDTVAYAVRSAVDAVAGLRGFESMVDLNDNKNTRKRDVLRLFKKAAKLARDHKLATIQSSNW